MIGSTNANPGEHTRVWPLQCSILTKFWIHTDISSSSTSVRCCFDGFVKCLRISVCIAVFSLESKWSKGKWTWRNITERFQIVLAFLQSWLFGWSRTRFFFMFRTLLMFRGYCDFSRYLGSCGKHRAYYDKLYHHYSFRYKHVTLHWEERIFLPFLYYSSCNISLE
jgi:hypothetical protein